jgi:hypothetical protein
MTIIDRDRFSVCKLDHRVQNLVTYGLCVSVGLFVHSIRTAPKVPEQIS